MRIPIQPLFLGFCVLTIGCKHETKVHELKDVYESFGRHKPETQFPFFVLSDEARKKIDKNKLELFTKAQTDIDLINSHQQPIFCKQVMVVSDGGTTSFEGPEYNITRHSHLDRLNGLPCVWRGITIEFKVANPGYQELKEVRQTWVEFLP